MNTFKPIFYNYNISNCVRNKGGAISNSKQKTKSSESYVPKTLLIPLGKFKGKYDTRKFRCYKTLCHQSNFNNCQHCRYLPYTSSPLKNQDYYCENIEIRVPEPYPNQRENMDGDTYTIGNTLVCMLNDVMEDYGADQNSYRNPSILENEKLFLDYYSVYFPSILRPASTQHIENARIDRALKHLLKITNSVKSLALVSSRQ